MQNSVKLEVYVHWTVRVENVTIGSKFFDIFRQQKNIDCVISFLIERTEEVFLFFFFFFAATKKMLSEEALQKELHYLAEID